MKKIAVILSGCGFKDGAAITEAVSTLISLSEAGVEYTCFAPDMNFQSSNHINNEKSGERNVMVESSRISRGQIEKLTDLHSDDFDGLVMPGGFGAALHLSDWAEKGAQCQVNPEVDQSLNDFYEVGKPICAICIAPAVVARSLGKHGVTVTIGDDAGTIGEIEKTGAQHETCAVDDFVTDREHKVITTPAYMYEAKPHEVFTGIQKAIKELVEMA